ncbi:hypothetical protein DFX68_19365 [Escherichia coli]|nr:hypothetical protein [Escherichia coli]
MKLIQTPAILSGLLHLIVYSVKCRCVVSFAFDSKHYRSLLGKRTTVEIRAGSSPAFGTTPYANRAAQERLFLCLKSVSYLSFSLF